MFTKDDLYKVFYNEYDGATILNDTTQYENGDYPNHRKIVFEYENKEYEFHYYSDKNEFKIKTDAWEVEENG